MGKLHSPNEGADGPRKIKAFISYSHKDQEQKQEFETLIKGVRPNIKPKVWSDRELLAGSHIDDEILNEIADADIFFALISRHYLASDYCKKEMQQALAGAEERKCRVVPVIVRKTTGWQEDYPIGVYLALPTNGVGPGNRDDQDDFWDSVRQGLRQLFEGISPNPAAAVSAPAASSRYSEPAYNIEQEPLEPDHPGQYRNELKGELEALLTGKDLLPAVTDLCAQQQETTSGDAAGLLLAKDPVKALRLWTKTVKRLWRKSKVSQGEQTNLWKQLEAVHLKLLPGLIKPDWISRRLEDPDDGADALFFTLNAEYSPPHRSPEILMARLIPDRGIVFKRLDGEEACKWAVPKMLIDAGDPALLQGNMPDSMAAVERIGRWLLAEFRRTRPVSAQASEKPVPDIMQPKDWKRLNALLVEGRAGDRGYYLVIPDGDSLFAQPDVLAELRIKLLNLPRILHDESEGEWPFTCDLETLDSIIETFWDLKMKENTAHAS